MEYDFTGLKGHNLQREFLAKSIIKGKIANSYLFHGSEGIGKKLVAMEFAAILNCTVFNRERDEKYNPDCDCISCLKIKKGVHPDVSAILSEGLKEIKIDQVRDRIEDLLYLKSYEGLFKVALVDDAELMNINAQNAFLKTLEEPPPNSIIILISSKPQYLLPTIVSRCQRVEFFSLTESIIKNFLNYSDFTPEELEQAVMLSRGSPAKAQLMISEFLEQRNMIIRQLSELKITDASGISEFTEGFTKDKTADNSDKIKLLFETLFLLIQDILLIKNDMGKEYLLNRDLYSVMKKIASDWSFEKLFATGKFLEEAWGAIFHSNVNKQYVLENVAMEFAQGINATGRSEIG